MLPGIGTGRRGAVTAAAVGVLLLAACGSSSSGRAVLSIETGALVGSPVRLSLSGVKPGEHVTLAATTRDASGRRWSSSAVFVADGRGTVVPARQAPVAGRYRGIDGQGLVWSMRLPAAPRDSVYRMPRGGERLKIVASAHGRPLGSRTIVHRVFARRLRSRHLRPRTSGGLYGNYFAPPATGKRRAALLVIGGSEGGMPSGLAALFADHGYPALALAYFREPGLPATLDHVPLEYFAHALRWLARQPGVDPRRVIFYGVSRGSEAALLVAAHFPTLVSTVVAFAPSNVVVGSFPGCNDAAWTLHGRELPYRCRIRATSDLPAAVVPIERFPGRLFLACGGDDLIWPSCAMAHALLRRHHGRHDTLLVYPNAGHGVDSPVPGLPGFDLEFAGGTAQANPRARRRLWPRLLGFLGT